MSKKSMFSTPTTKRSRFEETPISHNNKSPKILQLIEQKYAKQNQIMIAQIEECVKKSVKDALSVLEEKVQKNTQMLQILSERVTNIELSVSHLNEMTNEINKLKTTIKHQENLSVSTNLRLCGIPYDENENLIEIFGKICSFINLKQPNIKSIHRISNNKKKGSADGVILVKLFSSADRNNILRSISKYKRECKTQLTLDIFSLNSTTPFFVNEDLTSQNYKILQAALRLKRMKCVSTAFTLRGFVYVKRFADDTAVRMESEEELNKFFRPYDQSAAQNNGVANLAQY